MAPSHAGPQPQVTARSRVPGAADRGPAKARSRLVDLKDEAAAEAVGFDETYRDFVAEPEHAAGIAADQALGSRVSFVVVAGKHRYRNEPISAVLGQRDKYAERGDAADPGVKSATH